MRTTTTAPRFNVLVLIALIALALPGVALTQGLASRQQRAAHEEGRNGVARHDRLLDLTIDVTPGDPENLIDLSGTDGITVAVMSTPRIDASTIDPASVVFAGAPVYSPAPGRLFAYLSDLNQDGLQDLVASFAIEAIQLSPDDEFARLDAVLADGEPVVGFDSVRVVAVPPLDPPVDGTPATTIAGSGGRGGGSEPSPGTPIGMMKAAPGATAAPRGTARAHGISWGSLKNRYR
jgi:hypothetical protein